MGAAYRHGQTRLHCRGASLSEHMAGLGVKTGRSCKEGSSSLRQHITQSTSWPHTATPPPPGRPRNNK